MITINGQFAARRMTGQERFAYEIVSELDKICRKGEYEIVVPRNAHNIPRLNNIEIKKIGKLKGSLWEQVVFTFYMFLHPNRISLNLCSIMPVFCPGIVCIHDICYKLHPEYFTSTYSMISMYWHRLQYKLAKLFSPIIFTVSNHSKNQMVDVYKIDPSKINVLGNGWNHFERVADNEDLLETRPDLFSQPYFFSLGSIAPNKNIQWILDIAKKHLKYRFLIAGNADSRVMKGDYNKEDFKNVSFLGYLKDEELKCLMKHCKGFIFPSFYEGFGIPPLEAMSVGAKCIVSRVSCMPEIFGNSVYWIDPSDIDVDLDELLKSEIENGVEILKKYRYDNFAQQLHKMLCKYMRNRV